MTNKKTQTNEQAEVFLNELYKHIENMNSAEAKEITQEIRSHIYESLYKGTSIEDILQQLGNPKTLAKAYVADYQLSHKKMSLSPIISVLQLSSLGLIGTVLIPILFVVSALFIILAVTIIGIACTNLLGVTHIPLMVISSNYMLTGFPQFISAVFISILMIGVGLSIVRVIQKYCKFVINKYKTSTIIL
ncbi:DNA phosphorothioation-dependent restriction protein DptG [Enterococcus termitis]|nr:DNA phosphorothioation-dependent restriction protein DptG [Enterococcus termitis]